MTVVSSLVDGGATPCNLVDVRNLAACTELALWHDKAIPGRIFVTDDEQTTWADLIAALKPLIGLAEAVPAIDAETAKAVVKEPRKSILDTAKFIISGRTRAYLRQDPLLASADAIASGITRSLLPKRAIEGYGIGATRLTRVDLVRTVFPDRDSPST